jgi:beta-phosphoglucomutase
VIRGVIFDMDGVLIDAREWHFEALNRALALFGFEIPAEKHAADFDGLSTRQKLERLSSESGLPRGLHAFINQLKQDYTAEIVNLRARPRFDQEYLLQRLQAEGFRLGVASNSIRASIDLMLGRANILERFEVICSNEDVKDPKPSPEIYNLAIDRIGLQPEQVLVVEDNPHGLTAARASGARVLAVQGPHEVNYANIIRAIREAHL